jgi:hypothetical protein
MTTSESYILVYGTNIQTLQDKALALVSLKSIEGIHECSIDLTDSDKVLRLKAARNREDVEAILHHLHIGFYELPD